MLAGGFMLVATLWMVGQTVQRSRYRRDRWQRRDTLVAVTSLVTILMILGSWMTRRAALIFYPFPRLDWPAFNPLIGLSLLLIATPTLAVRLTGETAHDD